MKSVIAKYLDRINAMVCELETSNKKIFGNTDRLLFAYRGEPRDYGNTRLTPSIFRNSSYIDKEKHLFELLEDYDVIEKGKDRNIEKMIDAQHYVSISRSLDITFNVLVSLFFACTGSDEADGYVYVFCFPNYCSPHSKEIEELYERILEGKDEQVLGKNYKVITHTKNNERITAQSGGFIFFPGKKSYQIKEVYYRKVVIEKEDKGKILFELNRFFGINEAKLFPEKQFIAGIVRDKYTNGIFDNICSGKNEDFVIGQLKEYFERLDYELEVFCRERTDKNDDIVVKRLIRKEKSDIYDYLDNVYGDDDYKKQMEKYVDEMFDNLRRSKL